MDEITCEDCGETISPGVLRYSGGAFGRGLCMKCQGRERKKTYPPKLTRYLSRLSTDSNGRFYPAEAG